MVQSFSFTGSHLMQQSLALGAEGTPSGEVQASQEQQVLHLGLGQVQHHLHAELRLSKAWIQ